ncbi:MAG: hypothetical protein K6E34_10695 [Lachnospiraceae bacterium]|nr:hypothetical protein [Lachnospiraceae bacterium]
MNVSFVFPDFSVREFERAVEVANEEISGRNRATSPARILFYFLYILLFIGTIYGILSLWVFILTFITAKSEPVMVYGLMAGVVLSIALVYVMRKLIPCLIGKFFEFTGISAEETYTFHKYAERKDETKRLEYRRKYLAACGIIEVSEINDVSVNCKGEDCTVDVQFVAGEDRPRNIRFNMPCRMVKSIDEGAVVDFRRECVLILKKGS